MRRFFLPAFVLVVMGSVAIAGDWQKATKSARAESSNDIQVKLSGPLFTVVSYEPATEEDLRPGLGHGDLASAAITAGGAKVRLDWSRSPKIRDEILWWSLPRAGDARTSHAEVTGRMVFKKRSELGGTYTVPPRLTSLSPDQISETLVPVVIVDSFKGYLAIEGGPPRGSQPDRKRVIADESRGESSSKSK